MVIGEPHLLCCLYPDTSRLENRLWAFFAKASSNVGVNWLPKEGVEFILLSLLQLREMICEGDFNHALHVSLIGLALTKGFFLCRS